MLLAILSLFLTHVGNLDTPHRFAPTPARITGIKRLQLAVHTTVHRITDSEANKCQRSEFGHDQIGTVFRAVRNRYAERNISDAATIIPSEITVNASNLNHET